MPARSRRGATVVEFAIVAPLLLTLVLGVVQLSLAMNRAQGLHAAAREGARAASLETTTDAQVRSAVASALDGVTGAATSTVTITPATDRPCDQRSGQTVTVQVSAPASLDLPLLGARQLTLHGKGSFRCE